MLRKLGGFLLIVGLGILIGYGLYWFFALAFVWLHPALRIAIAAIAVGFIILLVSLGRERYRASKEERDKFKEVEK